jgi:guanine deaminase
MVLTDEAVHRHMRHALRLAEEALQDGRGGPFGAVIVYDSRVVGCGANRVVRDGDPTAHAEVVAIRAACRALGTHVLSGCVLFASCEPCPMCWGAIHWSRIDRIWYAATRRDARGAGFDDDLIWDQMARPLEMRNLRSDQILRQDALRVFDRWRSLTDKVSY